MSKSIISGEHYNELSTNQEEDLFSALASIQETIVILKGIQSEIISGTFSQEKAQITCDDLTNTAGINFVSALEQYAWSDQ